MDAVRSSETSVTFYQTTRRHNPEDSTFHSNHSENLKSNITTNISGQTMHHKFS
jgi:hypothetical protein